ncbi:phosphate signaling complex protein PhoU [candidate division WOR-3 bacterium]|nr:phosphate signaling complex protein PhoU [candidate division WOR-3 bacterium]
MLDERMKSLKKEIVNYASLVESMIEESIAGLSKRDKALLESVMKEKENKANNLEMLIEEHCIEIIAQFEPRAKNLRLILMILKMNNDLERMADHAVNIADSASFLIKLKKEESMEEILNLSNETKEMLKDSIDSFIDGDTKKAKKVCQRDDVVDKIRDKIIKTSVVNMCSDLDSLDSVDQRVHIMRIAKNLERIADLSTNICEDTIYMVEGKDIKHGK